MLKKLAIFFASAAAVGIICFVSLDYKVGSSRRLLKVPQESEQGVVVADLDALTVPQESEQGVVEANLDPCANNGIDEFAQDPTGEWCYIRMYKCSDVQVPWWTVNLYGLRNSNTGDLAWGAGGKALGEMTCAHYGEYLEVWRVAVKRELMISKPHYHQCLSNNYGGTTGFGWRYKGQRGSLLWR